MIIQFAIIFITYSLYILEVIQKNLLIQLGEQQKAILILQGQVSNVEDENNYQYCPSHLLGCWVGAFNDKSNRYEQFQQKIGKFHIYDQEKHQYNTEYFSFLHTYMEQQTYRRINNFISLSPLASDLNSFVYFGYTLCISQDEGYLKTNQNEVILENKIQMTGIKSQIQQNQKNQTKFSIQIQYLELEHQTFDISNYSIILDNEMENCVLPIELMMKIFNLALSFDFALFSNDNQYQFIYRETNKYKIENLGSIKLYNFVNQPLFIMPEDYISYNFENAGFDILKLVGDRDNSKIVLGQSFLRYKIIHYSHLTLEIFIEQLEGEKCNIQSFQKDSIFDLLVFKIIFIIIMSIFVYGILRKIRSQYLLKKKNKFGQQQLFFNNEVEVLK